MTFEILAQKVANRFTEISKTGKLFRSRLSGDKLWDLYITSFKPEHNPVFRDPNSSVNNCNMDKSFIRRYGNVVGIDENFNILTMFDIDLPVDSEYYLSCKALTNALQKADIQDVFFETFDELNSLPYEKCNKTQAVYRLGFEKNHKIYSVEEAEKYYTTKEDGTKQFPVEAGKVYQFPHFYCDLPKEYVDMSGSSQATIIGKYRDDKNVFQRAMQEIPADTLELVRDLINQNSLLDGKTHLYKVEEFLPLKREYDKLTSNQSNWCWVKSYRLTFAKFKNELIGVLCTELAEGVELNKACQSWNKRVDPVNYMKAVAPITKKQIEEAKKFVEENGYEESFNRRFATIDDIDVNQILHLNGPTATIKTAGLFDKVKATSTRHKRSEFDGIQEISIDKFMSEILPTCSAVEAFFENRMTGNLLTLTTSNDKNSKPIFKYTNNFSKTFNGNLAGKSQIKEEVKSKGGKVDGVLRFSMMWADGNGDNSDLDLHCIEPDRNEIYYANSLNRTTGGNLDIDIRNPNGKLAVENITFPSLSRMKDGVYKLFIHQFASRNSQGFKAEIEFNDEIYAYTYNKPVSGNVQIAEVTLKNGVFTIVHKLEPSEGQGISREVWNMETNNFHKVNLVCLSPNHWGDNNIGNKYYLFMLEGCAADVSIRSFHNEDLNGDLQAHRKVMDVLAMTNMLEPTTKQLAGLGFNSTVADSLILRLSGTHKRVVKIKF